MRVEWAGGDVWTCVCERGSVLEGPRKQVLGKGTREGTCSLFDASGKHARKEMLGMGQRKEHARLLTRVGMCAGKKCSQMCQRALTQRQGGGALQRGHGAPLEALAQCSDACGVDPPLFLEKHVLDFAGAQMVGCQAVNVRRGEDGQKSGVRDRSSHPRNQAFQRALTQKQTLYGAAAHLSEVTELPLSPSQSLVMPSAV